MMYCLGEESIAEHMGERKPREQLTAKQEDEEELPELTLSKEASSFSVSVEAGEEDDIKVVQVGEKQREFTQEKFNKQQH